MGDLIRLWTAAGTRRRIGGAPWRGWTSAELFFDLRCAHCYLAAEQLERAFDELVWTPASWSAMRRLAALLEGGGEAAYRRRAEARATALRLPLVWPERWPAAVPAAMRVAAHAAERGRGAPFALAAMRLAFCGGFDLEDPETLAEAAAAGGLALEECFAAARDTRRDRAIARTGRRLAAVGADRLPAVRAGGGLHWGEAATGRLVRNARLERAARR
jgi:2-hydroxychromene-2-carboxylate isomerase